MSLEERITDLEIRLTYQNKIIATLDEVVREFTRRVERLERQVAAAALAGDGDGAGGGGPDEKPPHY